MVLFFVLFFSLVGNAVEPYFEVSGEVGTPHIPWAVPLEGGALRALSIVPRQGLRDAIELGQRIEVEQRVVPLWDAGHLGYDPALPETHISGGDQASVVKAIEEGLSGKLDVVVLGGIRLEVLPEHVQQGIIQKVGAGCGLIVVQGSGNGGQLKGWLDQLVPDGESSRITRGLVLADTAGWSSDGGFVATSVYEQGRVVQVAYPDSAAWTHCLVPDRPSPHYDYADYFDDHLALLVKSMRWAAQREASRSIVQITSASPGGPDEEEIPPGFPEEFVEAIQDSMMGGMVRPFRFFLDAPAETTYDVRVVVRNPKTGQLVLNTLDTPLYRGNSHYNFDLLIGAGEYRFDAFLLDGERVVDFFSEAITVEIWPEIEGVDFNKAYLMPHDTLELKVQTGSVLGVRRYATLYVRAVDSYGRKVLETSEVIGGDGGVTPIQLNFSDLLSPILRVELFALEGEQVQPSDALLGNFARTVLYFPVRNRQTPWSSGIGVYVPVVGEANAQRYLHTLWKKGIQFYTNPFEGDEMLHGAVAGLGYVPLLDGTQARNPEFKDNGERADALRQNVLNAWAGGAGRYWLGAHAVYGEQEEAAFFEQGDMGVFRSRLQRLFPDLEMLNAAWNRRYIHWDGVEAATRDAVRGNGLYPNWLGLRKTLDEARSGGIEAARRYAQSIDTEGIVGLVVREDPIERLDIPWSLLAGVCDGVLYESVSDYWALDLSKMASFREPGQRNGLLVRPQWLESSGMRRHLPWRAALYQLNDVWCGTAFLYADDDSPQPMLLPDGRMNPNWAELMQQFQALQYGPAEVVQAATRVHDGVAIYYSRASHALNVVETGLACDSRESELGWLGLLNALGYQSAWVDAKTLHRRMDEFKVLVLPGVRALGDDEVDMFFEFVRRGGHLIADVAPGMYTEYGVKRDHSPFAGVMGVLLVEGAQTGVEYKANATLPGLAVDTCHEKDTAQGRSANVDAPLWLENRTEEYATLLLNHVGGSRAFRQALQGHLPPWTTLVQGFLGGAGLESSAFRDAESALSFDGEAGCFAYGAARVTIAYANPLASGKQVFAPRFGDSVHVYEMLSGETVSRPQRARYPLEPGAGVALAALPYAVDGLELVVPEESPNGARIHFQVSVKADTEHTLTHPVVVELVTLQGAPLLPYRHLLWCVEGVGSHYFSIALNDQIGTCMVRARDLLSGKSMERVVKVGSFKRPANVIQGPKKK